MNWTFFDLETTGVDPASDRIIHIGIVSHDDEPVLGGFDQHSEFETLINPQRPIPMEVQELTGITDAMVANAPTFETVAANIASMLQCRTLVGFGCHRFDVPLLAEEFERVGIDFEWPAVIDAGELFKIYEPRTLDAAVRFYCGRSHDGAHNALADARATRDVFLEQTTRYPDLSAMTEHELAKKSRYDQEMADPAGKLAIIDGQVCFNTFRNKGVPVVDDIGYARWMLNADFPAATRKAILKALNGY